MSKKITIDDVARETNVSKATVSYILNGKNANMRLSDETVERVLKACERLEYSPDKAAVALSKLRSMPVGTLVLSPWLYSQNSDFMSQLYSAFKNASNDRRMNITFMPYENGAISKSLRISKCKKFDAIVLVGTNSNDEEWLRRHAHEYDGKLIAVNRLIESEHISSVYGNDYDAQYALASAVVASNHYSSYVIINEDATGSRCRIERTRALRDVLKQYDTVETEYVSVDELFGKYQALTNNTCFFFTMYLSASLFLAKLNHSGVSVPDTCGVTAYDVHTLLEPYLPVRMTTVDPKVSTMVERVCDIAFALKDGAAPCKREVCAELVNGNSAIHSGFKVSD